MAEYHSSLREVPTAGWQAAEGVRKSDAAEAAEYPSCPCEVATPGCKKLEGVRAESKLSFRREVAAPGCKYEGLHNANVGTALLPHSHQRLGTEVKQRPQPSRRRHLPAILATTDAGAQRSGATLPSFLPRGLTPVMALEVARNIDPFQRALDLASSPQDK